MFAFNSIVVLLNIQKLIQKSILGSFKFCTVFDRYRISQLFRTVSVLFSQHGMCLLKGMLYPGKQHLQALQHVVTACLHLKLRYSHLHQLFSFGVQHDRSKSKLIT